MRTFLFVSITLILFNVFDIKAQKTAGHKVKVPQSLKEFNIEKFNSESDIKNAYPDSSYTFGVGRRDKSLEISVLNAVDSLACIYINEIISEVYDGKISNLKELSYPLGGGCIEINNIQKDDTYYTFDINLLENKNGFNFLKSTYVNQDSVVTKIQLKSSHILFENIVVNNKTVKTTVSKEFKKFIKILVFIFHWDEKIHLVINEQDGNVYLIEKTDLIRDMIIYKSFERIFNKEMEKIKKDSLKQDSIIND